MATDRPAFDPLDDDPFKELNKKHEQELADMRKAFEQEFNDDSAEAKTASSVEELADEGLERLSHTIKHSPNESLVARIAMWAVDKKLEAAARKDGSLYNFLEGLEKAKDERTHT